jgi:hypothetical protein
MRTVDQKRRELFRFLAEHSALFAGQGSIQASYRVYRGRKLGPFFRLSFREGGKQRSQYIGCDRNLAAEIEKQLQKLQEPLLRAREVERWLGHCRQNLKVAKLEFRRRLEKHGLRLQGNEVRGWRVPQRVAVAPTTPPAWRGAATAEERSAYAQPPVPRQPSCWNRRFLPTTIRRWPALHALLDQREYRPEERMLEQPEPWAKHRAAPSRRVRNHAVY